MSQGHSYFVFALVGFVVWTYFSTAISNGTTSLLVNAELLTKVPFPKIAAPTAALLPGLVDLVVGIVRGDRHLHRMEQWAIPVGLVVGLPIGLMLLIVAAAGPALMLERVHREVPRRRHSRVVRAAAGAVRQPGRVPAGDRAGGVADVAVRQSPVRESRPPSVVARRRSAPEPGLLAISVTSASLLLVAGFAYFRRREAKFVDII